MPKGPTRGLSEHPFRASRYTQQLVPYFQLPISGSCPTELAAFGFFPKPNQLSNCLGPGLLIFGSDLQEIHRLIEGNESRASKN